jgi:hypothetical protein
MKKALAGVLAVVMTGVLTGSAMAQVPNVQVYFDSAHTQTQTSCPGGTPFAGPPVNLYVVANNWNMNITGIDFSISYPPSLLWVADQLTDPSTQAAIGTSPTGVAIATANCCPFNGFQSVEVLYPLVLWGNCDCSGGPQAVVVGGADPSKPGPTAVRKEDFTEHAGVGMTSLICPGAIATEPTTWGQVKALYR